MGTGNLIDGGGEGGGDKGSFIMTEDSTIAVVAVSVSLDE